MQVFLQSQVDTDKAGQPVVKLQVPEKRDTLSKKLYFFPGYVAPRASRRRKDMST